MDKLVIPIPFKIPMNFLLVIAFMNITINTVIAATARPIELIKLPRMAKVFFISFINFGSASSAVCIFAN